VAVLLAVGVGVVGGLLPAWRASRMNPVEALAEGRTLPQIADTLGIGYKTAANNCSRIKAKLRAASTADLIRIAIRSGLVDDGAGSSVGGVDSSPRPP